MLTIFKRLTAVGVAASPVAAVIADSQKYQNDQAVDQTKTKNDWTLISFLPLPVRVNRPEAGPAQPNVNTRPADDITHYPSTVITRRR